MTRTSAVVTAVLAALAMACGGRAVAPIGDAGARPDGGANPDAGAQPDAGSTPDAGPSLLDEDPISTTPASFGDHEPTVAASPDGHLAVSWLSYVSQGITIGYRISLDNGATWGPATLLPFPPNDNVQANASVAADSQGNLYLAWGAEHQDAQGNRSYQHVFFAAAKPGALEFGAPVEIDDPAEVVGVYDQPHVIVTANGTLNVSYEKDSVNYTTSYVVDAASTDGSNWTRANVAGPGAPGSGRGFARICRPSGEGRLFIVYNDSTLGIALSWSDDDGSSWTGSTTVQDASETGQLALVNQSCVTDGTQVWVLYPLTQTQLSGPYQTVALLSNLRLAHSATGASIDTRMDVEDTTAGRYYLNPLLETEGAGGLDLAYYAGDCTDDSAATLRLSHSPDGTSFGPSVVVHQPLVLETSRTGLQWLGDYLGLASGAGALGLVYVDNSSATSAIGFFSTTAPATVSGEAPAGGGSCPTGDGGSTLGLGSSCSVPQTQASVDACAAVGLQCAASTAAAASGSCQLPSEFAPCATATGCLQTLAALACVGVPGNGNLCIEGCQTSTDCVDTGTSCQPLTGIATYCLPNYCGPGLPISNGSAFYGPCTVESGNDGYCFPFEVGTTNGTGTSPEGYCYAVGTAVQGAPCTENRSDGGLAALCGPGLNCTSDSSGNSFCEPVCEVHQITGETDAGAACGGTCAAWVPSADWGLCLTTCDAPAACAAPESCQPFPLADGGALSACLP